MPSSIFHTSADVFQAGDSFVVCDCGGGTVVSISRSRFSWPEDLTCGRI